MGRYNYNIESRAARRDIESQTRTDNIDTAGSISNDIMTNTEVNDDTMADTEANIVPRSTNQEGLPEIEAY